ncbi:MAG: S41 family peptidase [Chitinophagia bacterium]|jgi:carboxyl-terminal processing protease
MQENNNLNWVKPLFYGFLVIVGILIGVFFKGNFNVGSFTNNGQQPIQEMIDLVNSKYVDSVSNDSAGIRVANYYLAQLDPHSVYIPPADLNEVNEQLQPNFKGIGIEFQQFRDSVFVAYVMKEGPADKAGLKIGDILLNADDSIQLSGKKWDADDIRKKIKGPANSKVKLLVNRLGEKKSFVITRDHVSVSSVDASYMIDSILGYIRINKFADRTYEAFMQALEPLLKKGMKSLVIDLRGNGGGLLSEAVGIADELLSGNKLIVYTQGVHSPRVDYFSKREGLFEQGGLTILMDETAASASEVLAGALQDWDRATIVGRRSFGKGLVQQQFKLSNGGALRLTTAKYYTPLGRNIQRPYAQGKQEYENDFITRLHEDALGKQDSSFKGPSFKTPKGHLVYGGGGIYPDKWVNGVSIQMDTNYKVLWEDGLLNDFVLHWYVQNNKMMEAQKNPIAFLKQTASYNYWGALYNYASPVQKNKLKALEKNKGFVENQIRALVARTHWYKQGFIEVQNALDPNFKQMLP